MHIESGRVRKILYFPRDNLIAVGPGLEDRFHSCIDSTGKFHD